MQGLVRFLIALAVIAGLAVAATPAIADSWDAAADFSSANNPSGAWSYGYTPTTTAYSFTPFTAVNAGTKRWANANGSAWLDGSLGPGLWSTSPVNAVLRWTAPATGTYTVKMLFRNTVWVPAYPSHFSYIQVLKNNTTLLFNSSGPTEQPLRWQIWADYGAVLSLNSGDTIDFLSYRVDGGNGQTDCKIKTGSYVVSGHVQDSNGLGLGGVKVAVNGANDYTVTDSAGNYTLTVFEGSYTLTASLSSFNSATQTVSVSGAGTFTVPTIVLTTTGVWNAKTDFTPSFNPSGQWSYGYCSHTSEPMRTTNFARHPYIGMGFRENIVHSVFAWSNGTVYDYWNGPASKPWCGVHYGVADSFLVRPTGQTNNDTVSIARWTAPAAGWYSYSGFFRNDTNNHTYGCDVVKNGNVNLFTQATLVGYTPNNQANFNGAVNLNQGDTIDFVGKTGDGDDNRVYLKLTANVQTGAPGFRGYVENANHVRLPGATVVRVGGAESVVTDSAGNYELVLPSSGTYTVIASKSGYEPVTYSNVVVANSLVTQNFTLPSGATISGNVTENLPPNYPAMAGTSVASGDGVYSTTANSAGSYSLQVTRGTYSLTFYKSGHAPKSVVVDASAGNVSQDVRLDMGFDLAYDFTSAQNPNGAWSYGFAMGTVYRQTPDFYKVMTGNTHYSQNPSTDNIWFAVSGDPFWGGWGDAPGSEHPVFVKNMTFSPIETNNLLWYGGPAYREPGKVLAGQSGVANAYSVARFTAPTSGYFHITARFAGTKQASPYTQSKVALMYGNTYVFGGPANVKQLNGFVGRAVNNFTDSAGTTAVYTYSFDRDVAMGDRLDAIVLNDVQYPRYNTAGGMTQVDLTIVKDATTITGRVTSTLPGQPPIPGATVVANGQDDPWPTYQTLTDANGYYIISARPGTYNLEARGPGYNTVRADDVEADQDGVVIRDFALGHSGTWSLSNDFSPISNRNGQWSFGSVYNTAGSGSFPVDFYFQPYTELGPVPSAGGMLGWKGMVPTSQWYGWVAKNTTGAPVSWTDGTKTIAYVEPNHMSFAGGDTNFYGAPAIRWTSPDSRVVKINLTIAGQNPVSPATPAYVSLFHNLVKSSEKSVQGFVGRASVGYADSVGPAPTATYETTLAVTTGETFEFAIGQGDNNSWAHWIPSFQWPIRSFDIWLTISPGTGTAVTTIQAIKALNQGDTVFMNSPVQLACATVGAGSFDKSYGNSTPGSGHCFYVQSDDRQQGLKCITDGTVPAYSSNYKVTFTGVVDNYLGQKVVRVQSINSAAANTEPRPLGKASKSLTNGGTLVKVWGKITQIVPNTGSDNDKYTYEYVVINDGGQDIKIPMHCQFNWMVDSDSIIGGLAVGHYVAVTGIAGSTTSSDVAVYPRNVYDFYDYTAMQR